jgi:hypothetical protein
LDLSSDINTDGNDTVVNPDARGHILYKQNAFWNFIDDQLVALCDTVRRPVRKTQMIPRKLCIKSE